MQKVIYAWNYLDWGGAQIYTLSIIKEVIKEFEVLVVLPEGSDPQFTGYLDDLGVSYEFFETPRALNPAPTILKKIKTHWQKFRSELAMARKLAEFDLSQNILHVELSPQQSLSVLLWLAWQTTVFITGHNSLGKVSRWRHLIWKIKFRMISQFSNFHVFCANEHAKKYFESYYSKKVKIEVTRPGIDPTEITEVLKRNNIRKEDFLKKYGFPQHTLIVLCAGRFIERKGGRIFLETAAGFAETDEDILLVWLTPQLPDESARKILESYGPPKNFRLVLSENIGKNRPDILTFFRVADIFALPSYIEGLPIAVLEAMALGIPCISTDVYAIPEAIKHLETGILIEAGRSESLAEAIRQLKNDSRLRETLAARGRIYVHEHFDERKMAVMVVKKYKEAIARKA